MVLLLFQKLLLLLPDYSEVLPPWFLVGTEHTNCNLWSFICFENFIRVVWILCFPIVVFCCCLHRALIYISNVSVLWHLILLFWLLMYIKRYLCNSKKGWAVSIVTWPVEYYSLHIYFFLKYNHLDNRCFNEDLGNW